MFYHQWLFMKNCFRQHHIKLRDLLNTLYAKSLNGYMDEELFFSWFKFFVAKTQHLDKRLLIIDGHGSHISLNVIDTARENNMLYCLPPHTTHILQPLDVSLYKPLKNHFSRITDFIILASVTLNEKVLINKTNFHVVFLRSFWQNNDNNNYQIWFSSVWDLPF